jgi:hypothetical protein
MPLVSYLLVMVVSTRLVASSLVAVALLAVAMLAAFFWVLRRKSLDRWLLSHLVRSARRRGVKSEGPVHVLLCLCDHYEPQHGKVSPVRATSRVENWVREYPKLFGRFRDADGRPPRHSFFFPIDEYDAAHVDRIAELCRAGFGEVEIHLHHDQDTSQALRERLLQFKSLFRERHGLLPHRKDNGEVKYGFIHGNWALDNSRPDGRWCGVNNELDVLRETGCYADFTLPSAPSPTQTRKINSIYYAVDDPHRPMSHNWGQDVGAGEPPPNSLLLIQGPLLLNWRDRRWGVAPRVENGDIQSNQPPTMRRLDLWLRASVQVARRPDWFFVKLHTHGAPERNQAVLLGPAMAEFHESLSRRAAGDPNFQFHYVTAREMYNLAKAAEAGYAGPVADARDYELVWSDNAPPNAHRPSGLLTPSAQ